MRTLLFIPLVLILNSCGNFIPKPVETKVPVVQSCLTKRPISPVLKFDSLPKAESQSESAAQVRILWLDRQALIAHSTEWETAAAGCQVIQ